MLRVVLGGVVELGDKECAENRYAHFLKYGKLQRVGKEEIIFAELPEHPATLAIYRKQPERNPEHLALEGWELTHVPLLQDEESLQSLSLQHNCIGRIENLEMVYGLVHLNLADNDIKEICSLQKLTELKTLVLSRNRIERIKGLQSQTKLELLDLQGNNITKIENLNNLAELKSLNLSHNQIAAMNNLTGLTSLKELNLSHNLIGIVANLSDCPKLLLLLLSNNRIEKLENVSGLAEAKELARVALDGNPVELKANLLDYCAKVCPQLKTIEAKQELRKEEVKSCSRDESGVSLKSSECEHQGNCSEQNLLEKDSCDTKYDHSMAEAMEGCKKQLLDQAEASKEDFLKAIGQEWKAELARLKSLNSGAKKAKNSLLKSRRAEVKEGAVLCIYGNALEVLDNAEFHRSVTQISFQYISFDVITNHSNLPKLMKFQKLSRFHFAHNYMNSFSQLSRLEKLPFITELAIEHNSIAKTSLLKLFILHQFSNVVAINFEPVKEIDRCLSRSLFLHFDHMLHIPKMHLPQTADKAKGTRNNTMKAVQELWSGLGSAASKAEGKLEVWMKEWDKKVERMVEEDLKEVAGEGYLTEGNMKRIANA